MDTHTAPNLLRMTLPGEHPQEASTLPPTTQDEVPVAAESGTLRRILPSSLNRRNVLMATVVLVGGGAVLAGAALTLPQLLSPRDPFSNSQALTPVAAAPTSPALSVFPAERVQVQPEVALAPPPVETHRDSMLASPQAVLAVAPATPAPNPSPAPAAAVASASEPEALAEHRQLLLQATAPLAPAAAPAVQNEEVGKLSSMVTALSAMLGESLKGQIALRKEVADLQTAVRTVQADTNQRVAFLEARLAVAAAQNVATGSNAPNAAAMSPAPAAAPRPQARSASSSTTYRITGAANNLAYLVAVNPAAGQAPAVEAKPGSDVPGYGKVLSISQQGTSWVIKTERGDISN